MKSEDFAAWLSAISGMSAAQRAEALAALEKAAAEAGLSAKTRLAARSARTRLERAASSGSSAQGCPHCAGREIVGWGRSDGLLRFRCKSCGRTFNALTKTPMAHLRKKEKWLDHARAMIEGKSLAKTAALCGVHPTTAFRWRHRFLRAPAVNKPRTLARDRRSGRNLHSRILQRPLVRPAARGAQAGRQRPGIRACYQDNIPVLVARDRKGATFDAVLPQVDSASIGAALAGRRHARQIISSATAAGRSPAFARRAGIPFHAVPSPGKPAPEAPHLHINNVNAYHSRLKQWLSRFNGVATKNLPNYLGWRRALEAWGDQLAPPNWIKGAIGNGPYQQITL